MGSFPVVSPATCGTILLPDFWRVLFSLNLGVFRAPILWPICDFHSFCASSDSLPATLDPNFAFCQSTWELSRVLSACLVGRESEVLQVNQRPCEQPAREQLEMSTVTSTSTTRTPSGTRAPRDDRLSGGQVAGVSIACTLVGIVLGLVISFVVFRHKRRSRSKNSALLAGTTLRDVPYNTSYDLEGLPQETGHDTLRNTISGLEISIKNFVHEFFHNQPLSHRELDDGAIVGLLDGEMGDRQAMTWPRKLRTSQNRSMTLKAYLARVLFSRIDPSGNPEISLLPEEMLRCYHELLPAGMQNGTQQSSGAGKQKSLTICVACQPNLTSKQGSQSSCTIGGS